MRATSAFPDTDATKAATDVPPAPFSKVFVTITQQEHFELKMAACYWQTMHRKAAARCDQQEVRHDRLVREIKAQALNSNVLTPTEN